MSDLDHNNLIEATMFSGVEEFRVRCPECFKAYQVLTAEVSELRPRFACSSCQTRFWVSFEEALQSEIPLIGNLEILDEPKAKPVAPINEIYNCPKCKAAYDGQDTECRKCGVVFLKFIEAEKRKENKSQRKESYSASKEVRSLWEEVLNQYESQDMHKNFINAAWADKSLDYAAHKYATILELAPQDEWAAKMLKEVEALSSVRFEVEVAMPEEKASFAKDWAATLFRFRWTNLVLLACGFIIMIGFLVPSLRNLVGFGTALLFFVFGLRYFFRVF